MDKQRFRLLGEADNMAVWRGESKRYVAATGLSGRTR